MARGTPLSALDPGRLYSPEILTSDKQIALTGHHKKKRKKEETQRVRFFFDPEKAAFQRAGCTLRKRRARFHKYSSKATETRSGGVRAVPLAYHCNPNQRKGKRSSPACAGTHERTPAQTETRDPRCLPPGSTHQPPQPACQITKYSTDRF